MSEFVFENQGTNTYLVYEISQDDTIDTLSLGMLTNNKISGLASALFTQMDATKYIKYNVSSKVSVKQFFSSPVNKKRLLGVFKGITNALISAEDYMIDENTILLDLDYIFSDVSTCETVLICLPIQGSRKNPDLGAFFKEIIFGTQFDQTENCDHVAKIINYLNSAPVFSLNDFKLLLEKIENESAPNQGTTSPQPPVVKPIVQPAPQPKAEAAVQGAVMPPVSRPAVPVQPVRPVQQVPQPPQGTVSPAKQEKNISMFSLLMHYSKENKELYKAQKAQQKLAKPQNAKQAKQKKGAPVPVANQGFAIPGQAVPTVQPVAQQPVPKPQENGVVRETPAPAAVPPKPAPAYVPAQAVNGQHANFGETTVLGGSMCGETTVLTAQQETAQTVTPYLIRAKNQEKILLDKPVFRIGKERSYVDYFIGDNTAISRSHASIIVREGECCIIDTNSTNHTYVNGSMVHSNIETKLTHGDTIRLANEDFEYRMF